MRVGFPFCVIYSIIIFICTVPPQCINPSLSIRGRNYLDIRQAKVLRQSHPREPKTCEKVTAEMLILLFRDGTCKHVGIQQASYGCCAQIFSDDCFSLSAVYDVGHPCYWVYTSCLSWQST